MSSHLCNLSLKLYLQQANFAFILIVIIIYRVVRKKIAQSSM